jgi:hypothetical protein
MEFSHPWKKDGPPWIPLEGMKMMIGWFRMTFMPLRFRGLRECGRFGWFSLETSHSSIASSPPCHSRKRGQGLESGWGWWEGMEMLLHLCALDSQVGLGWVRYGHLMLEERIAKQCLEQRKQPFDFTWKEISTSTSSFLFLSPWLLMAKDWCSKACFTPPYYFPPLSNMTTSSEIWFALAVCSTTKK